MELILYFGLCIFAFSQVKFAEPQYAGGVYEDPPEDDPTTAAYGSSTVGGSLCQQPAVTGPCLALFKRYFYNSANQSCEEFTYGGCGGNKNNFLTKEKCEEECGSGGHTSTTEGPKKTRDVSYGNKSTTAAPDNSVCKQPLKTGPCKAALKRWGYNGTACAQFTYGGCQGNENNFKTEEECEAICEKQNDDCPLVKIVPPDGCTVQKLPAKDGSKCPQYEIKCTKGPCQSNPCKNPCENCINEPKQCIRAPCPQYRCETRPYCKSPRSNSTSSCAVVLCSPGTVCQIVQGEPSCVPTNSSNSTEHVCQLPPETGPCRAAFPRWYFNGSTGHCEQFTYGGCNGNENNFETRQECESYCAPSKPGQCPSNLPSPNGLCAALCNSDSECSGTEKCCRTGCGGFECMEPVDKAPVARRDTGAKRRRCPKPRGVGICAFTCESDSDCGEGGICCPTACGGTSCA